MCGTCGCGEEGGVTILKPGEENHHHHNHDHTHDHHHDHEHDHHHNAHDHHHGTEIRLERDILHKNNLLAERNRGFFEAKEIVAINLVSSPGSGKTTLLEKTIKAIEKKKLYVIEGDQQTLNDARRIEEAGAPVVQVNTGSGCHLDAQMINMAVKRLEPENGSVLMIENVGNLVCPSMFDLGESKRVVIMSTTEGEDKPLKYPTMFQTSHLCIINKTDLLPYLDFDVEKAKEYALRVNHHLEFIEVSAKTGEGIEKWVEWVFSNSK